MTKVFLVCSGLGHVNRGFESFAREAFDVLSTQAGIDVWLFKGGGSSAPRERALGNLRRTSPMAHRLAALVRRSPYFVEQLTFTLSLLPELYKHHPDIVFFSDGNIGNLLWHWRRISRQKYALLLSNGGPISPPFQRWDGVQQVTPKHWKIALAADEPAERQHLLPYGVYMEKRRSASSPSEKREIRAQLDLPDRPIIICVAAINSTHKRVDYLIEEVAALPWPRPFLLLVGAWEDESSELDRLARTRLGVENYTIRTVPFDAVATHLLAADVFVLPSLREGFGRAYVEAAAAGLPCCAHDYDVARFVLGDAGYFTDFSKRGALTRLLDDIFVGGTVSERTDSGRRYVQHLFGWDALAPAYADLLEQVARGRRAELAGRGRWLPLRRSADRSAPMCPPGEHTIDT